MVDEKVGLWLFAFRLWVKMPLVKWFWFSVALIQHLWFSVPFFSGPFAYFYYFQVWYGLRISFIKGSVKSKSIFFIKNK